MLLQRSRRNQMRKHEKHREGRNIRRGCTRLVTITKGLSYVPGLDVGVLENHRRSKIPFDGLGRI